MFVGVGASRVRICSSAQGKKAPCIIFIALRSMRLAVRAAPVIGAGKPMSVSRIPQTRLLTRDGWF